VNRERAKELLLLHRPGLDGDADPELAEAHRILEHDEELRRWYKTQRANQDAVRSVFRNITPPAALKEQIISERPWHTRPVTVRHLAVVAVAAVILFTVGLWWSGQTPQEDKSFASYRSRMVGTALRSYGMEFETDDMSSVRAFLKQHGAPDDFASPAGLAQATCTGCLTVPWRTGQASMICFRTGRPMPPGQSSDLWFFVVDHAVVPDAPEAETPLVATVNAVTTASWTRQGRTYVLAVDGDELLLRKFL
jgi:hypothetical protein